MTTRLKIKKIKLWCTILVLAVHSLFPLLAHAINQQLLNSPGGLICSASNLNADAEKNTSDLTSHNLPCPYCQSAHHAAALPSADYNWVLPLEVSAGFPVRYFSLSYSLFIWATPPSRAPPALL